MTPISLNRRRSTDGLAWTWRWAVPRAQGVRQWGRGLLHDLLPSPDDDALSVLTESWLSAQASPYCWRCGATGQPEAVSEDRGCAYCVRTSAPWTRVYRLGPYASPLSDWIVATKFTKRWLWADWLGQQMARVLPDDLATPRSLICPAPMHWVRRMSRGFDQATLMAQQVARRRNLVYLPLLKRVRHTCPQTLIPPSKRPQNVRQTMALRRRIDLAGATVILVDDVKTTGSTLREACRHLRHAGARDIVVLVAAVADPHGNDFQAK